MKTEIYENFPLGIVIFCNLVPLLIYATGAYILSGFGILMAVAYLFYCFWMEYRVMKLGCVNCYYYGKLCGTGKGKLCSLLFKQGDPTKFAETEISWVAMLPDFMVIIFPMVGGIVLLIINFSWFLLAVLIFMVVLYFGGNSLIRGPIMCKYCQQRVIGCPAERLFRS
jgi:hypothetical protein